mgnify:FL=1
MSMKKKWMIFSLALALLGASSVGTAYAYFTTNARADGEYGIELGNDTDITVDDLTKSIAVRNNENSQAVFVRVKLFYPDEGGSPVSQVFVEGEDGWEVPARADGFYYYTPIVEPGESTTTLRASIQVKGDFEADSFNVIVVAESAPVIYDENGQVVPDPNAWA